MKFKYYFEDEIFSDKRDAYGRIHHILTYCARDLRPFCSWKGRNLWQVDVSSCQPAIASLLYREDCEEKRRYIEFMKNNSFYDFLNEKTGSKYDLSDSKVKKDFKIQAFAKIFYCDPEKACFIKDRTLAEFFAKEFPILAKRVLEEKEEEYKALARTIQKIEAQIIIETVARGFAEAHAGEDICLITIHDSLVSTEEHMNELAERLSNAMTARLGFSPNAKRSQITAAWTQNQLNDAARAVVANYICRMTMPTDIAA